MSDFNWKSLVGTIAPLIGTALGGPVGGVAMNALTSALGLNEDAKETDIAKALATASPGTLLKLKEADQTFETEMAKLGVDLEKIAADDRASARQLQKETKSYVVPILATVTVTCFFGVVFWVLSGKVTLESTLLGFVLGQVSSKAEQVYNFFFGSSAGSKEKTKQLVEKV